MGSMDWVVVVRYSYSGHTYVHRYVHHLLYALKFINMFLPCDSFVVKSYLVLDTLLLVTSEKVVSERSP